MDGRATWAIVLEVAIVSVILAALLTLCSYRFMGALQAHDYRNRNTIRWMRKKCNHTFGRHAMLFFLCALSSAVVAICFGFSNAWSAVIGLVPFVVFLVLYFWADNRRGILIPTRLSTRVKAEMVTEFFLYLIFIFAAAGGLCAAAVYADNLYMTIFRYLPLTVFPLLISPIAFLANLICKIYYVPNNYSLVKRATKAVKESDVIVIGICGALAKTLTKNILHDILARKYDVFSTPKAHSSLHSLSETILSVNMGNYDVFIAEMGATSEGRIASLCSLCPPKYSIVTGLCPEHVEDFGNIDNMVKSNGEMLKATSDSAVIADDCYDLFESYDSCEKVKGKCVSGVTYGTDGTEFTLTLGGESRRVKTKLLGSMSTRAVALSAQMAYVLGMSMDDIVAGIEHVEYVEHRLVPTTVEGYTSLDDAHDANLRGAKASIHVLKDFEGRKVVITPGLFEMGVLDREENLSLGKALVGLDRIVLVGSTSVKAVQDGYLAAGGDPDKICIYPTHEKARGATREYLEEGDALLFLNTVPTDQQ